MQDMVVIKQDACIEGTAICYSRLNHRFAFAPHGCLIALAAHNSNLWLMSSLENTTKFLPVGIFLVPLPVLLYTEPSKFRVCSIELKRFLERVEAHLIAWDISRIQALCLQMNQTVIQ